MCFNIVIIININVIFNIIITTTIIINIAPHRLNKTDPECIAENLPSTTGTGVTGLSGAAMATEPVIALAYVSSRLTEPLLKVSESVGTMVASTSGAITKWRESGQLQLGLEPSEDRAAPAEKMSVQAPTEDVLIDLSKAMWISAPVAENFELLTTGATA
jgi:hypothetical protein